MGPDLPEKVRSLAEAALRDLLDEGNKVEDWDQGWSETPSSNDVVIHPAIEAMTRTLGIKFKTSRLGAAYDPNIDSIGMPDKRCFYDAHNETATQIYNGTLLHEIVHATGHGNRLKRKFGARQDEQAYAREELVAELGSVMLMRHLGIAGDITAHTTYFLIYLERAGDPEEAIRYAMEEAQRAMLYILEHDGA